MIWIRHHSVSAGRGIEDQDHGEEQTAEGVGIDEHVQEPPVGLLQATEVVDDVAELYGIDQPGTGDELTCVCMCCVCMCV